MDRVRLFQRLPYPFKLILAGARGWQLERWRYGPETEELVGAALDRESWTADRWRLWHEEQTARLLDRAAQRVPWYRDHWSRRRQAGDRSSWQRLENWPVLEKEDVRRQPRAFLADDVDPAKMFAEHTSGSTGKPLQLWWSRQTARRWYALVEARSRRWYGVSRRHRWAILGGQLIAEASRTRPPFWVWNAPMRQLYLSSVHLSPDFAGHYLEAMKRHGVRYLYGYSSALHSLCEAAGDASALGLDVAVTNAEPLFQHQRRSIENSLGCPVRETYGMAELVAAASECEHGALHQWPEAGVLEFADPNDQPVANGEAGQLLCTGLLNSDQPLIRYRVGDLARRPEGGTTCPCGRSLPRLRSIEGRIDDVVVTEDNRRVGRLDPVFKGGLPLLEAQIVQLTRRRIVVFLVPAPGWSATEADDLTNKLHQRLGISMQVTLQPVASLPRTRNGKLRAVVSLLDRPELATRIAAALDDQHPIEPGQLEEIVRPTPE